MNKYSREDLETYYNVIGYDVSKDKIKDVRLDAISSIFFNKKLGEKNKELSYELSSMYGVLFSIIKDGFFYESKESQEIAFSTAFEIINDLSSFEVTYPFDASKNFKRANDLLKTIIAGLTELEDICRFGLIYKNSSFESLLYG